MATKKYETTTDRIDDLINRFDDDIQQLAKEFGVDAFASSIDVSIQNIPLEVFHSLTDGMDVRVKMYDVSEGIPCLEAKYKVSSWGWVNLGSNPIRELLDEDEL